MTMTLRTIDTRSDFARGLDAEAFRDACRHSIPEASPGAPKLTGILSVDGVPVARVEGSGYRLAHDWVDERRPLTAAEAALPLVQDEGMTYFSGCYADVPGVGVVSLGHKVQLAEDVSHLEWCRANGYSSPAADTPAVVG